MFNLRRFPDHVTSPSDQSRQLGRELDRILAGKTTTDIVNSPEVFRTLIVELWHNLPCLTDESVLLCMPFYLYLNGPEGGKLLISPDLPAIWQINSEYGERLLRICSNNEAAFDLLAGITESERKLLIALFKRFEDDVNESFEHLANLVCNS